MRYSVLGFKQSEAVKLGLSLDDLLLLDYIIVANGTPSMFHVVDNEVSYVWLSHDKLSEDLPILNISEGTLRNKLAKLKADGYITSISVNNKSGRGSRTYYSVTDKTMSLRNDVVNTTMSLQNDAVSRPCHSKMTSYNKLNKQDNKLKKDNKKKLNKEKLLDGILAKFQLYNFSEKVQERLLDFYSDKIDNKEVPREHQLIATLDMLASVSESVQLQAINNSIRGGWKTIYLPKSDATKQQSYVINSDKMSNEEHKKFLENYKNNPNLHTF
jgi:DNA-binding PadR family transcriptional regulator